MAKVVVQPGNTLSGLMAKQGIPPTKANIQKVATRNKLTSPNVIQKGRTLDIRI